MTIIHGMYGTRVYRSWKAMKERCLNKKHIKYKNYGGKGVAVCNRWLKFENFYADMGDRPESKSLDRRNNNRNYCKENCKWSTIIEQNNNKKTNRLLLYKGKTKNVAQWAKEICVNYGIIYDRLRLGWSVEKALSVKPNKRKN